MFTKILTSSLLLLVLMDIYCLQDDVRKIEKEFHNQLYQSKSKHMLGYLVQEPVNIYLPHDYLIMGLQLSMFMFLFVLFCTPIILTFYNAIRILFI